MAKTVNLMLIGCLATLPMMAADVTGQWTTEVKTGWKIYGQTDPDAPTVTVTYSLKADGAALSGTVRSPQTSFAPVPKKNDGSPDYYSSKPKVIVGPIRTSRISNGKIDGDTVSFDVVSNFIGGTIMTTHYTGKLDGDLIHFSTTSAVNIGAREKRPPDTFDAHRANLNQQDASDAAISAAQVKKRGEDRPAPGEATPGGVWQVESVTDRMSRTTHLEGFRRYRSDDSQQPGELQVTATCDAELLKFQIVFLSDAKPHIALKQNTAGGFGHAKPWVEMRVRIDNEPPREVASEEDFTNYATIVFSKWAAQGRPREDGAANIARYALAAKSAGTIEKAIEAHSILVELTTENNAKEYLEIQPQEPSFKTFRSRCGLAGGSQVQFQQIPHGPAADGFKFLYTLPLPQREYRGSIEGFLTEFPAFMQRAATVAGVADRDFSKETAFIIDAVKTCSQITPDLAKSAFVSNGKTVWRKADGVEELKTLGPQYEVCEVKNGLPVSPRVTGVPLEERRGLVLRIEAWGSYTFSNGFPQWQDSKGFIAQVLFSQMKGDDRDMRGLRLQPTYDYTVIHAIFDRR
jgi:hypothetical protein